MSSIYIHIPFCKTKCLYCDFYSKRCNDRSIHSRLIDALCLEFLSRRKELRSDVDTIYIGGGTPSLITGAEISRLINNIKETGGNRINASEITIEANPDDVTHEMARSWYESGINRVSMGIQSFKDNELRITRVF